METISFYLQRQSASLFANSTAYMHIYFFLQASAAMALKLQWNNDFPWTQRERKFKMFKMKQQNAGSTTHFIRVCIRNGLERDSRGTERGSLQKVPQQWLSCRHRAGGTHGDVAEPTLSCSPLLHSPLHLFPVNQNRDFAIHLLSALATHWVTSMHIT